MVGDAKEGTASWSSFGQSKASFLARHYGWETRRSESHLGPKGEPWCLCTRLEYSSDFWACSADANWNIFFRKNKVEVPNSKERFVSHLFVLVLVDTPHNNFVICLQNFRSCLVSKLCKNIFAKFTLGSELPSRMGDTLFFMLFLDKWRASNHRS